MNSTLSKHLSWGITSAINVAKDFITDLPLSNEFTTVLVIIDRFSKACRLIPMKGLPTAMETTLALFRHVYGIPEDIISDRGTQFSLPSEKVWDSAHVHFQRAVRNQEIQANK